MVLVCKDNEFKCNNKMCIPIHWAEDGENDCGDMSDEAPRKPVIKCMFKIIIYLNDVDVK